MKTLFYMNLFRLYLLKKQSNDVFLVKPLNLKGKPTDR
jgi:hypothetical protein